MTPIIKRPLRALWRWTYPVRRPLLRKLEALLTRCCVQPPVPPPHVHLVCRVPEETHVVMDHMVRELVRLQKQVEYLQHSVDDLAPGSGLSVVGRVEGEGHYAHSAAG